MEKQRNIKVKSQRFINGHFIKGPIPLDWILEAGKIGNKSLELGCYIWFVSGLKKSETVPINLGTVGLAFGISRRSMQRALGALERASLIKVTRSKGKMNLITILLKGESNGTL